MRNVSREQPAVFTAATNPRAQYSARTYRNAPREVGYGRVHPVLSIEKLHRVVIGFEPLKQASVVLRKLSPLLQHKYSGNMCKTRALLLPRQPLGVLFPVFFFGSLHVACLASRAGLKRERKRLYYTYIYILKE